MNRESEGIVTIMFFVFKFPDSNDYFCGRISPEINCAFTEERNKKRQKEYG